MKTGYPSIDKPWLRYYPDTAKDDVKPKEESMYQMLERRCADWLDEVALEMRTGSNDYDKGVTLTYRQFLTRIKACAKAFKALGVQPDEIVPLITPNIPESRILIYALNYIGATAYPISPMLSPVVFHNIITENHARTLVIFVPFWDKYSESVQNSEIEQIIFVTGLESTPKHIQMMAKISGKMSFPDKAVNSGRLKTYNWNSFVSTGKTISIDMEPYYDKNHVAVIIGTSGTTGTPKGVCLSDNNLNAMVIGQELSDHYRRGEVALDILIQSIGYGISTMHSVACIGLHTVIVPELVTNKLPKLVCKVRPDCFPGGPVHYINISRSDEFSRGDIPIMRSASSGGASLDREVEKKLNGVDEGHIEQPTDKIIVRQGYGSTECCGAATAGVAKGSYRFGSIGIPMVNVTVSIFKPGTDEECKYGEEGEICVTGDTVMMGYLNNQEETDLVLKRHSDGLIWLHQGDLGWCDENGHFFITDRIKNIFMRTGFNVHPSKIAEFIETIPGVKECTVIGVPHPEEQMVPVAFVILDRSVFAENAIAKEALSKACTNNLSESDIPLDWVFVDEFPRNLGGKIDSKLLVQMSGINYMAVAEPNSMQT